MCEKVRRKVSREGESAVLEAWTGQVSRMR